MKMFKLIDTLSPRTQIGHYWIHEVLGRNEEYIFYLVEDMRLNRQFLLKEYYPTDGVNRGKIQNSLVEVNVEYQDMYRRKIKNLQDVYEILKRFNHSPVISFNNAFEKNGTIYAVFNSTNTKTVEEKLELGIKYIKSDVENITQTLIESLITLQLRGLFVKSLPASILEIDSKKKVSISGYADFISFEKVDIKDIIYDIGLLMYSMIYGISVTGTPNLENLKVESNTSKLINELITRMLCVKTSGEAISLQEILSLLQLEKSEKLSEVSAATVQKKPFSLATKIGSLVILLIFIVEFIFTQPKIPNIATISLFNKVRLYTTGYVGNVVSQRMLGEIYEKGHRSKPNIPEALEWYKKAAVQGNLYAQIRLGELYSAGDNIKRNEEEAAHWFSMAAQQGNASAQYKLACYKYNGTGIQENKIEAYNWFYKAGEQGYTKSFYWLGTMYYDGESIAQDYVQALYWLEKSSEVGDENSDFIIAQIYAKGYGVEKDERESFKWYLKAAEQGHNQAQYNVGYAYEYAQGTLKDDVRALLWYTKSSAQGNLQAKASLTVLNNKIIRMAEKQKKKEIYQKNLRQKTKKRIASIKHSTNKKQIATYKEVFLPRENDNTAYIKGYQYERKKEDKEALKWYLKAANQGDARAQYKVGWLYHWGKNMKRDYKKAMYWYKKSAEQKNIRAYYQVAYLYSSKKWIGQDEQLAFVWCQKAAKNGLRIAQKILGFYYEFGRGTEIDYHKAMYWYGEAAKQGSQNAKRAMIALKKKL